MRAMALTKADIGDSVSRELGMSKSTSVELVETILDLIKNTLAKGEDVLISGFGKFCVKDKRQRKGRNPQTGTDMSLPPRRVVTFKSSGILRNKVNGE